MNSHTRLDRDTFDGALHAAGSGILFSCDDREYLLCGEIDGRTFCYDVDTSVGGTRYNARVPIDNAEARKEFARWAAAGNPDLQVAVRRDLWLAFQKIRLVVIDLELCSWSLGSGDTIRDRSPKSPAVREYRRQVRERRRDVSRR